MRHFRSVAHAATGLALLLPGSGDPERQIDDPVAGASLVAVVR
jgi:hypothetical protein